jgi:hypothetical protein
MKTMIGIILGMMIAQQFINADYFLRQKALMEQCVRSAYRTEAK